MTAFFWNGIQNLPSRSFVCGYCGNRIATQDGWFAEKISAPREVRFVYVCHLCGKATFFDEYGHQTPGVLFGSAIEDVPDPSLATLYDEARRAMGVNSLTMSHLRIAISLRCNSEGKQGAIRHKKALATISEGNVTLSK